MACLSVPADRCTSIGGTSYLSTCPADRCTSIGGTSYLSPGPADRCASIGGTRGEIIYPANRCASICGTSISRISPAFLNIVVRFTVVLYLVLCRILRALSLFIHTILCFSCNHLCPTVSFSLPFPLLPSFLPPISPFSSFLRHMTPLFPLPLLLFPFSFPFFTHKSLCRSTLLLYLYIYPSATPLLPIIPLNSHKHTIHTNTQFTQTHNSHKHTIHTNTQFSQTHNSHSINQIHISLAMTSIVKSHQHPISHP